jgi:hypothetical protein
MKRSLGTDLDHLPACNDDLTPAIQPMHSGKSSSSWPRQPSPEFTSWQEQILRVKGRLSTLDCWLKGLIMSPDSVGDVRQIAGDCPDGDRVVLSDKYPLFIHRLQGQVKDSGN